MVEAIADTNALVYAAKQGIDFYTFLERKGYTLVVPSCVIKELKSLASDAKKGKDKKAAKLAMQIASEKVEIKDIGKGHPDDLILKRAKGRKVLVVTNDKKFKHRLKQQGVAAVSVSKTGVLR